MTDNRISIFTRYAKHLLPSDNKTQADLSLKDHAQIPLLIDTLCRQKNHHLLIIKSLAETFNDSVIETLAQHLTTDNTPKILQDAHCIYFDVTAFMLSAETVDDIENDFRILLGDTRIHNKRMIFVMNQLEPLLNSDPQTPVGTFGRLLKSTLINEQWRLIALTNHTTYQHAQQKNIFLKDLFTTIKMNEPSETEALAILKNYRAELENFHNVTISEETLPSAMSLASTYLAGSSSLDKALELLDSAAARANSLPQPDLTDQKPIITSIHLAQVVSSWTQIPMSHLQNNKFQMSKLVGALQRHIFGQDSAVQNIAVILQNACIKLHKKSGPLCSFMLAGPPSVGKATLAYTLAEHLFGNNNALLRVNLNKTTQTLSDLTVTTGLHNERCMSLLNAIEQTPYAIIFFENIDQFSNEINTIIKNILTQGYVLDAHENKYDFRHAIIIISTTLGADKITSLMQATHEKHKQIDLMQLVFNDHVSEGSQHIPGHEIIEKILPELTLHFSAELLQKINVITFLPLDYTSLEKIMYNKLKFLAKRLDQNFGIELSYAPEIIKFLAHEALWQNAKTKSFDKLLEQQLYACVSHEILSHIEAKNKPKRLMLQLNDNGQLLRCEFITANENTLFNL
jgi:ATP-dependent Clp protease ATP-binding subunit ClpA